DKALDAAIKQTQQAQVTGDSALAARMDQLQATLEGDDQTLNAAILETQRTQAQGDQALAEQLSQLQAKVTSGDTTLGSAIQQAQQAQVDGDKANADAITKVQASLNQTTAAVETAAKAVADLKGNVEAGWYTKAQIAGEGGGFGLSVKLNADGTVLSSFVIDADVFAVMSRAGGATTKRNPFVIKNGTVYMNHAMMDTAEIGNVIAKYINVQHLKGSLIEGGSFRGGDLWLGENATGQFGAYGKKWNAGIDSMGRIYGSDVYFSNGTFQGNVLANSGTMNNVTIRENCQILGQLDVNQVVGDITTLIKAVANFSIPAYRRARNVVCIDPVTAYGNVSGQGTIGMAVVFYLNGVEKGRVSKTEYVATGGTRYLSIDIKPSFEIPANTNATITFGIEPVGGGVGISSTGFSGQAVWLTGLK
ncbi:phage tail tip protein, partial [Aeromonas caviae]